MKTRLHPPTVRRALQLAKVRRELTSRSRALHLTVKRPAAPSDSIFVPLTTVSVQGSFDALIDVSFKGGPPGNASQLTVDSGNSTLIVPRWEDIAAIPNYKANYSIVGQAREPWGAPCNIVQGPIELTTVTNDVITIDNCVFYACIDNNSEGDRTNNFGAGCLSPWSSSQWNTPAGLAAPMQSALSYSPYSLAEFSYAPSAAVINLGATPKVASGSSLVLHSNQPPGFQMFSIVENKEWMALRPKSLSIGATLTRWPTGLNDAIAMIDTGGTCAFLSDPNGDLYHTQWPDPAKNPSWTNTSDTCESIAGAVTIELGDANGSYRYTIDTSQMPQSVQGLTLVMCKNNAYMMNENGMNIGGISALMNSVLVDYRNAKVGFKKR